jgi:hypothetical protein
MVRNCARIIDDSRVRYAALRADRVGDLVELRLGATGEEDPSPSRAKARATAPPIEPPAP